MKLVIKIGGAALDDKEVVEHLRQDDSRASAAKVTSW